MFADDVKAGWCPTPMLDPEDMVYAYRRYIENGFAVKMIEVEDHGLSVDTQDDLKRVEEFLNAVH